MPQLKERILTAAWVSLPFSERDAALWNLDPNWACIGDGSAAIVEFWRAIMRRCSEDIEEKLISHNFRLLHDGPKFPWQADGRYFYIPSEYEEDAQFVHRFLIGLSVLMRDSLIVPQTWRLRSKEEEYSIVQPPKSRLLEIGVTLGD